MNRFEVAGYVASALVVTTFCMKTMLPLRVAAIASNVAFIVYAFYDSLYPVLILHLILLPMNVLRMVQMVRLIRRVKAAAKSDPSLDWLRPFMKTARRRAGEILFSLGDHADCLYLILAGEIHLEQIDHVLHAGDFFGEIGLFSAERRRTQTARAMTDIELLWISESELKQVCYQNPGISFYFLRLVTNRLIANASRAGSTSASSFKPVPNAVRSVGRDLMARDALPTP
jgi:CRP-like cAMP-binding protein